MPLVTNLLGYIENSPTCSLEPEKKTVDMKRNVVENHVYTCGKAALKSLFQELLSETYQSSDEVKIPPAIPSK